LVAASIWWTAADPPSDPRFVGEWDGPQREALLTTLHIHADGTAESMLQGQVAQRMRWQVRDNHLELSLDRAQLAPLIRVELFIENLLHFQQWLRDEDRLLLDRYQIIEVSDDVIRLQSLNGPVALNRVLTL
jgi:hypothetical protein